MVGVPGPDWSLLFLGCRLSSHDWSVEIAGGFGEEGEEGGSLIFLQGKEKEKKRGGRRRRRERRKIEGRWVS